MKRRQRRIAYNDL